MKKNTNFVNECLEQLDHLSVCREVENECSFPFCIPLRRDMYGMKDESNVVVIMHMNVSEQTAPFVVSFVHSFFCTAFPVKTIPVKFPFVLYVLIGMSKN